MSLKEYQRKRDFKITKEPIGKSSLKKGVSGARRFVVQKHAASRLHYDFRLELGGTLKSWAVPKGMPFAKGEKRLAVHVEDHPLSYIDFEGPIPKGQYGGGTVMVWDYGTYEPESATPLKELKGGKLHFTLTGHKLKGEWYLVRLRDEDQWLLIRGGDDMKPVSQRADNTSALSGKTMKQLESAEAWSNSTAKPEKKTVTKSVKKKAEPKPAPLDFIEPMKAKLVENPPQDEGWLYEVKFDGFRALAVIRKGVVRLVSRTENEMTSKFPEVVEALEKMKLPDCILDGEIVALDKDGRFSFQALQSYDLGQEQPPLLYYAFDLLKLKGRSCMSQPLTKRKEQLKELLGRSKIIRFSSSLEGDVQDLLKEAAKLKLEGLIGKKADSTYEAGKRSGQWIKLKMIAQQEVVIGGYTEPTGSRKHFGALIVGVYEKGELICTGKVGTGFNTALLKELHALFKPLEKEACPFANIPVESRGRWGQGITRSEMKNCTWLKPQLVCQVKFAEWTRDGRMRQPVFLGLRKDKRARDVVREQPADG